MTWILVAISAHLFWAVVNIGDKYVVEKRIKNPYTYMIWLAWLGLATVILIPFINFVVPDGRIFWWLALGSALHFYCALPYARALQIEEISRINVWWLMIPVFSFFIGWAALGENLAGSRF